MKYKILWFPHAEAFLKSLAPEPRQDLRKAIKKLAEGKTSGLDLRALEGPLQGYLRLRVRTYRVIYNLGHSGNEPAIFFVAAGPRSTIYEAFEKILSER
jgi:mRNA-degrading endonuclease RelE of RelBE toxin-antitoxin system